MGGFWVLFDVSLITKRIGVEHWCPMLPPLIFVQMISRLRLHDIATYLLEHLARVLIAGRLVKACLRWVLVA